MSASTESLPWRNPLIDARSGSTGFAAVGLGDTFLWGDPSGEAYPTRPSKAPLWCDPERRPSRTVPSRCYVPPYIPSEKGGGSCARGSLVDGDTHVSKGGGSTPPNAAVGARWRSMHVRFVTALMHYAMLCMGYLFRQGETTEELPRFLCNLFSKVNYPMGAQY